MKRVALVILVGLATIGCSSVDNENKQKAFTIAGKWFPNDFHTSYLSLNFGKVAVFDNLGDTINVFSYSVDYPARTLWLTDAFKQKRSAGILKLDADSLVFNHLWDLKTVLRFHRSSKK